MPKVLKTRAELTTLLLNEARQSGKCAGLADVFITGPHPERSVTWGFGDRPNGALDGFVRLRDRAARDRRPAAIRV